MISNQAQSGFEYIFKKAVTSNLVSSTDFCEIRNCEFTEPDETEFAILTVSSPVFRFFTIFYFNVDDIAQDYFCNRPQNTSSHILDNIVCHDAFLEFCNLCCGAMNRELIKHYPYLGMSTPYVLLKKSSDFIHSLNPGYLKHFQLVINEVLILHATLCVCDFGVVDFRVEVNAIEDDTGGLELF